MMLTFALTQGDYLLRILLAAVCGAVIGYEREARSKMAGIRTHTIVSFGAAIMVIISKYGFFDVILYDNIQLDASRIASGVVTAIGFLGAGIIMNKRTNISGVTTAAGIWATLGIGMAIGAGMWILGICSTVILLLIQILFHRKLRVLLDNNLGHVLLHVPKSSDCNTMISTIFSQEKIRIISTHLQVNDDDSIEAMIDVIFPHKINMDTIISLMSKNPEITMIDT